MTNPAVTACTADAWTKVATNVTSVSAYPLKTTATFWWTYRDTGDPVPSGDSEFKRVTPDGITIQTASAIDLYLYARSNDGSTTENVRVDVGLDVTYLIDG